MLANNNFKILKWQQPEYISFNFYVFYDIFLIYLRLFLKCFRIVWICIFDYLLLFCRLSNSKKHRSAFTQTNLLVSH